MKEMQKKILMLIVSLVIAATFVSSYLNSNFNSPTPTTTNIKTNSNSSLQPALFFGSTNAIIENYTSNLIILRGNMTNSTWKKINNNLTVDEGIGTIFGFTSNSSAYDVKLDTSSPENFINNMKTKFGDNITFKSDALIKLLPNSSEIDPGYTDINMTYTSKYKPIPIHFSNSSIYKINDIKVIPINSIINVNITAMINDQDIAKEYEFKIN